MPSCVVNYCRNSTGVQKKQVGITFHRIPKADEFWRKEWIEVIRKSRQNYNWIPSKSSVVCSVHFDEKDLYTTKCGLLRVVSNALPKKFLFEPATSKSTSGLQKNSTITKACTPNAKQPSLITGHCGSPCSPLLQSPTNSDVLYSPRKQRLKDCLTKKDIVIKKLRNKLKTANQKVRRLQCKNKSLKYILKTLKDKILEN